MMVRSPVLDSRNSGPGEVGVPMPTSPSESTYKALAIAPASTRNGVRPLSISSMAKSFAPPFADAFAVSCQSLPGKLAEFDASTNEIRRLFSFRRMVSNPKSSPLTQSVPTHKG
ncbi:hypothetical protein [Salipiger aestuarii]|uniref:hypothetical protein n=1 Tax=Salipiger aestuarii TaxID=568098 RepID=UPI00123BB7AE|nr:hypothetical protein [Salipiger aestuarii]